MFIILSDGVTRHKLQNIFKELKEQNREFQQINKKKKNETYSTGSPNINSN